MKQSGRHLSSMPRSASSRANKVATKRLPRPRDPIQLGRLIVDIATRQVEDRAEDQRDPKAVERGRLGGQSGGKSRAAKLSPEERQQIARKAAAARWSKSSAR